MIHDSSPWKAELSRDADLIERWAGKDRPTERRSFLLEKKVFLAAYALRKLDEGTKISTALLADPIALLRYPARDPHGPALGTLSIEKDFDLEKPILSEIPVRKLLNAVIHSSVFAEVLSDTGMCQAFLVTSEREYQHGLIEVPIAYYVELMRRGSKDYPSTMVLRMGKKGRLEKWAGHGEPPGGRPALPPFED